jgi:hypothetical protein
MKTLIPILGLSVLVAFIAGAQDPAKVDPQHYKSAVR